MNPPDTEGKILLTWQNKLLPFMKYFLLSVALFFFITTFVQLYDLQSKFDAYKKIELDSILQNIKSGTVDTSAKDNLQYARLTSLTLLEWNAMERRYHQANVSLMSRIWTRYLGFMTGMVLAVIGAAFILGKLSDTKSSIDINIKEMGKVIFATASPGLFLVFFGTLLMISTIFVNHRIEVQDRSIYTQYWFNQLYEDNQDRKPQTFQRENTNKDSLEKVGDDLMEDL